MQSTKHYRLQQLIEHINLATQQGHHAMRQQGVPFFVHESMVIFHPNDPTGHLLFEELERYFASWQDGNSYHPLLEGYLVKVTNGVRVRVRMTPNVDTLEGLGFCKISGRPVLKPTGVHQGYRVTFWVEFEDDLGIHKMKDLSVSNTN